MKILNNQYKFSFFALAAFSLALLLACQKDLPAPFENDTSQLLSAPTDVRIKLGVGSAFLQWSFSDDSNRLKEFRIYRKDDDSTSIFIPVGQTTEQAFADTMLANGMTYIYQISAVDVEGFEGPPSKSVSITPSLYSLLIDNGLEVTKSTTVNLRITAPENTRYMKLANDSAFTFANWEPFTATREWQLSTGDGLKTIYASFMDDNDSETQAPITAHIMLDTYAQIVSFQHDGYGRVLKAGDVLHVSMETSELEGKATAALIDADTLNSNSGVRQIVTLILYDNGTDGDQQAYDGIYETDYRIDRGLEIPNAEVVGYFTDRLGNVATSVKAPNSFVLSQAPTAVRLQEPANANQSTPALILRWSGNNESDFASYQIYRARDFLVTLNSTLVADITDSRTTRFVDDKVEPSKLYYYCVYVFDTAGNYTQSNIVSVRSPENISPKPVVLSQAIGDSVSLTITWSPSSADDFANYQLYRSTTSDIDTSFAPIRIINDINQTTFRDASVARNIDYFYQIFVSDKFGLMAGSNIVSGRIE